jgi:hypothetical protein
VDIEIIDKDVPRSLHELYPDEKEKVSILVWVNLCVLIFFSLRDRWTYAKDLSNFSESSTNSVATIKASTT